MGADGAAGRPPATGSADAKYFGPFGEPPADGGSGYHLPAQELPRPVSWPSPAPVPTGRVRTGSHAVGSPRRRRSGARPGVVVAVAALTALLVGGTAGFGGALLAGRGAVATGAPPPATTGSADPSAAPTPTSAPGGSMDTVAVAERALPGTVTIRAGRGSGSGFVLDAEGRILTNNHVIAAAEGAALQVGFADGRRQTATLVGASPSYDLAVIKVEPGPYLKPLTVGDSEALEVGQPVLALGAPLGLPNSVSSGIVSALNRPVVVQSSGNADAPFAFIDGIQTDAAINPGSSGGPLVDAQARVIGINSAILTRGNSEASSGNIGVGFAIPVNQAKIIADLLIADGKVAYPVIGVALQEIPGALEITSLDKDGPAVKAGLKQGDRITKIDDRRVDRTEDLIVEIRSHRPGEKVVLEYARGNTTARATVTLGGREG